MDMLVNLLWASMATVGLTLVLKQKGKPKKVQSPEPIRYDGEHHFV